MVIQFDAEHLYRLYFHLPYFFFFPFFSSFGIFVKESKSSKILRNEFHKLNFQITFHITQQFRKWFIHSFQSSLLFKDLRSFYSLAPWLLKVWSGFVKFWRISEWMLIVPDTWRSCKLPPAP